MKSKDFSVYSVFWSKSSQHDSAVLNMCDFTLLSGFGSSSTVLFGFVSSPARSYEQNSWFGSVSELWGQGLQGCDAKKCQEPKTAINAESIHIQNTSIQKKTVCWLPSGWNGFSICLLEREYNAFFFFTSKAPTAIVAIVAIVIQKYTKLCVALCFVLLWRCWTVPEPQKQNADLSSLVLCAMPAMCRIRSWHSQCRAGDHCTRGSWRANQLCFLPAGSHAGWLGRWRVKTWKRDNSS